MSLVKYGVKVLKKEGIIKFFGRFIAYIYYNYFINIFKRVLKVHINGISLTVDSRNYYQFWLWQKVKAKNEVEGVIKILLRELSKGDIFIDVGAWMGPYTMIAAKLIGKQGYVYAIEPDPIAIKMLKRNIYLNKLNNISVAPIAIADNDGKIKIGTYNSKQFGNGATTIDCRAMNGECVKIVESKTLPSFIKSNNIHPNLIKIDIEGGEYKLFKGARDFILKEKPKLILEIHKCLLLKNELEFILEIISEYNRVIYLGSSKENVFSAEEYTNPDEIIPYWLKDTDILNILIK